MGWPSIAKGDSIIKATLHIIRNFSYCSDDVTCQLFQIYCTNFYCASLWCCYNTESMRLLKVAYNRVFRILMNLVHRTSMSTNFVSRGMNPFKVIIRRLTGSFKSRIFNSMSTFIQSIVSSSFFSSADRIWSAGAIGGLILRRPRHWCPSTFYANCFSSGNSYWIILIFLPCKLGSYTHVL